MFKHITVCFHLSKEHYIYTVKIIVYGNYIQTDGEIRREQSEQMEQMDERHKFGQYCDF